MAIPYVEIDPEGILIRMRVERSYWHMVDAERELTWCGQFLSQGSERRPFSEIPEVSRCQICIGLFSENVVRHPDD